MKKTFKLFAILFACVGLSAMFTSCEGFVNILINSSSEKLVIRDDTSTLSNTDFRVCLYKTDNCGNRSKCVLSQTITVSKYDNAIINLYGAITANNYYEITIEDLSTDKQIYFSENSTNLAYHNKTECFIKAKYGYNYRLDLKSIGTSYYIFEVEAVSK